jgi:hypothetical protein
MMSFKVEVWQLSEAQFLRSKASIAVIDCQRSSGFGLFEFDLQAVHIRFLDPLLETWGEDHDYSDTINLDAYGEYLRGKTPPFPLRSVYFDSSLCPTSPLPDYIRDELDLFQEVTQPRGIDVIFEPVPQKPLVDSPFSLDFSEKQREVSRNDG